MNKEFKKYAKKVVWNIDCNNKTKKRIVNDIIETLEERSQDMGLENPIELMGDIEEVRNEFIENLDEYKVSTINKISDIMIMGLPLYHFTNSKNTTAKGIFACGPKAIGIVSVGAVSAGVISIGGISFGVVSLGGVAIALLTSFGGVAIAYDMAFGGLAIANSLAFGGLAISSKVAVGGVSSAKLMGYRQSFITPKNLESGEFFSYKIPEELKSLKSRYEEMNFQFGFIKQWIMNILG